ncbi:hypothetical protein PsAD2_02636 [Pseudovibrio axinellae]|uniref:Uncharacterized protein n=1 Tax=Pseudovibrio axinellae TaxID=989403 RepID=A0A165XYG3_9HYPH|nr:hypothetical protein PsAD2_02636 [Pseudovibrio axinellae]SER71927.1 hypothetical protein SAMN05421798_11811 [Pseudovibrio axinellae]
MPVLCGWRRWIRKCGVDEFVFDVFIPLDGLGVRE